MFKTLAKSMVSGFRQFVKNWIVDYSAENMQTQSPLPKYNILKMANGDGTFDYVRAP